MYEVFASCVISYYTLFLRKSVYITIFLYRGALFEVAVDRCDKRKVRL